jgi:hypothetical protein
MVSRAQIDRSESWSRPAGSRPPDGRSRRIDGRGVRTCGVTATEGVPRAVMHESVPRGVKPGVGLTAAVDATVDTRSGDDEPIPRIGRVAVVAHRKKSLDGGLDELRSRLAEHHIEDLLWYEVGKSKKGATARPPRPQSRRGTDHRLGWGRRGPTLPRHRRRFRRPGRNHPGRHREPARPQPRHSREAGRGTPHRADRPRRPLDLGRINGEHFAVMAGVGFDAELMTASGL